MKGTHRYGIASRKCIETNKRALPLSTLPPGKAVCRHEPQGVPKAGQGPGPALDCHPLRREMEQGHGRAGL